ncbi:hypothetical protein [Microterricola viridarii]|uniref:DUF2076 domain-containing protein n=1 Tax=Microterricola viridarii TaxID=412690 RepID=A0A109QXF9_9MICO|nr:hypothetical protein [Microterricola viridarii]AMB58218.1 hypothetical protein AWU67_04400 [Microterricola viridarii]
MDWLFGSQTQSDEQRRAAIPRERHPDEVAIERYRYLLRTAPPETIEQAHAAAFAQLNPEQRALVFQELSSGAGQQEQPRADDPRSLAQAATRRELQAPGTLERSFSPQRNGGMSAGGMLGSSMLGSIAGVVIGSAIAQSFLPDSLSEVGADAGTDGDPGAVGTEAASTEAGGFGGDGFSADSFGGDSFGDFGF